MNTPNDDRKQTDNMELLKQQATTCGPGCGCNATGKSSKTRWVIGAIVLVAASVMVVRAMIKSDGASSQTSAPAFATLAALQTPAGGTNSDTAAPAVESSVVTSIRAIAELNTVATKLDAVFVFLPGKEGISADPPLTPMQSAARAIKSNAGKKCGLFTLKVGSRDYNQIATQMSVPGVLAMVKGRGMSAISGDITEAKLVQGFVASSSAGGCSPSAGAGCCPK
jgi:hypothetical protein